MKTSTRKQIRNRLHDVIRDVERAELRGRLIRGSQSGLTARLARKH